MTTYDLRDTQTGEVFMFDTLEESINFTDEYENPQNLIGVKVYFCDGAGFNGVKSRFCYGTRFDLLIKEMSDDITNNEAEYRAIWRACEKAEQNSHIISDSQLCINQINGKFQCNFAHLEWFLVRIKEFAKTKELTFSWVKRGENFAGKELERVK